MPGLATLLPGLLEVPGTKLIYCHNDLVKCLLCHKIYIYIYVYFLVYFLFLLKVKVFLLKI